MLYLLGGLDRPSPADAEGRPFDPPSRVFIQGRPVPVEPVGSFRADVPLRDGKQTVAVVAIDPLGRRKQVDTTIVRDQSTPTVRVKRKLWQSR